MRHRTVVKTGRTAELQLDLLRQLDPLRPRSFTDYAAMVARFSAGYVRPLSVRVAPPKRSP